MKVWVLSFCGGRDAWSGLRVFSTRESALSFVEKTRPGLLSNEEAWDDGDGGFGCDDLSCVLVVVDQKTSSEPEMQ